MSRKSYINKQPEWFSLQSYKATTMFKELDWYVNLKYRHDLLKLFDDLHHYQQTSNTLTHKDFLIALTRRNISKRISQLQSNPLISATSETFTEPNAEIIPFQTKQSTTVNPLFNGDVFWILSYLHQHDNVSFNYLKSMMNNEITIDDMTCLAYPIPAENCLENFVNSSQWSYAKVDLMASDEQLTNDFLTWLREERQRRNVGLVVDRANKKRGAKQFLHNDINQKDFEKWCNVQVLPYLDLIAWGKFKEIKFTSEELGDMLYPDDDSYIDNKVNKTLKQKALELMRPDFLQAFFYQIQDT